MSPAFSPARFRLRLLFFSLVFLLLPLPTAALEEASGSDLGDAPRIGLLAVEKWDFAARETAFFTHLGELYGLEHPPAPADDAHLVCTSEEARSKAALLMERQDLALILAADPHALRALALEHNGRTPVLAFSPFCVPGTLNTSPDNGSGAGPAPPPQGRADLFFLFPEDFLALRLDLLQQLVGFKSLGFITPAKDAGEKARLEAATLENAATLISGKMLQLYTFADMVRLDEENCREALDSLFFDRAGALLLDGSGCFTPDTPYFTELLDLAHSRGMLPLSLTDPDMYRLGALVSPWSGDEKRLGRFLAAHVPDILDAALSGNDAGTISTESGADKADAASEVGQPEEPAPSPRLLLMPGGQPYFSFNLAVAASMAFEPSAGLLALTRSYLGLPESGGPAPKPEAAPAIREQQP